MCNTILIEALWTTGSRRDMSKATCTTFKTTVPLTENITFDVLVGAPSSFWNIWTVVYNGIRYEAKDLIVTSNMKKVYLVRRVGHWTQSDLDADNPVVAMPKLKWKQ